MANRAQVMRLHLDAQSTSNQTVAGYCTDHGISVPTFYYWRRKFADAEAPPVSGFIQLVAAAADPILRTLQLPSGLAVELAGLSITEIAELIIKIDRAHA